LALGVAADRADHDRVVKDLVDAVCLEQVPADPQALAVQLVGKRQEAEGAGGVALEDERAGRSVLVRLETELIRRATVTERRPAAGRAAFVPLALVAAADVSCELARIRGRGVDVLTDLIAPVLVVDREDVLVAEVDRDTDVAQRIEVDPRVRLVAGEP